MTDIIENPKLKSLLDFLTAPKYIPTMMLYSNIQLPHKRTVFLDVGDKIRVVNGDLADCYDAKDLTHEIIHIISASTCVFSLELKNILTGELETLKL